jgi:3-methyladenine DNA glycosylase Tag
MIKKTSFTSVYELACLRKGGEKQLLSLLSKPTKDKALKKISDDRFLAEFTKKVFQSGFVWRVVENKWHNFERLFHDFGISDVLMMSDESIEVIAQDPAIIRNFRKVQTVKENAYMIHAVREQGGTFAEFIADWPSEDIVGLWDYLKKYGSRLGGNTAPYALRNLGKDTFLLSRDVEKYLLENEVYEGGSSSKRSRKQIQNFFNELQQESGMTLMQLSQLVAYSTGDNIIMPEGNKK